MTKQEQIEEMAKERNEIKDIMKLLDKCVSLNPMSKSEVATVIYGNNYRKVPDGAVVLLIGENNQALDEKTIEYFVKHNEQIRKETAKEILKKVFKKDNLVSDEGYDESGFWSTLTYYIDGEEAREIEREYDVKMEEL